MNSLVPFLLPAPDEVGMLGTGVSTHKAEPFQIPESWRADGGFIPLSSDASVAVGNTHENGGINIGDNVVENNETLLKKDGNVRVYSDRLGYADEASKLSVEKGLLEKEMEKIDGKLNDLFQHQESSKEYAAGGVIPEEELPLYQADKSQWLKENIQQSPYAPKPIVTADESLNTPDREPAPVKPKTYHEQLLSLVEELKPTPDKKQETNLKRAAKYQALADFVNVLGDSFYGAKGAKIKQRDPNVTGSLKALQDYYDKLASGEAAYRNTKMGLLSKLADKADAQDALAGERAYQEGRDKLKQDAEDARLKAKIAADEKALGRKLTAAEKMAAKRLAAQKKDKPEKGPTKYGVIADGKEYGLSAAEVSNIVGEFTKKYTGILTNKDAKTPFPADLLPALRQLLQGGMLSSMGQQLELINRFAKYDPEMKSLIKAYAGESTQPANTKTTTSFTPDFNIPGSNEAYVAPGQAAMTEEELQAKLDNLDFNL